MVLRYVSVAYRSRGGQCKRPIRILRLSARGDGAGVALAHRIQQFGIAVFPRPTCSVLRAPLHRQAASSLWDRHKLSVSWYPHPTHNESKPYWAYTFGLYCYVSPWLPWFLGLLANRHIRIAQAEATARLSAWGPSGYAVTHDIGDMAGGIHPHNKTG